MAKAKRIFELAKELGVPSKEIVAKCKAEDVPGITNHMSTVKLGLIQTINEWFSANANNAPKANADQPIAVDAETLHKPAKRRKAKRPEDQTAQAPVAQASDASTNSQGKSLLKAPIKPKPTPKLTEEQLASQKQAAEKVAAEKAAEKAAKIQVAEEHAKNTDKIQSPLPEDDQKEPALAPRQPVAALGKPNVPTRPTNIKPMGVVLDKPQSVKLRGPKVIRVEQPDNLAPPRSKRQGGPQRGGQGGGRSSGPAPRRNSQVNPIADGTIPGIIRSTGPARGRGAGGGAPGGFDSGRGGQGGKRRGGPSGSNNSGARRGRTGASHISGGPTKFTEADIADQEARLNRSAGFLKSKRRDLKRRNAGQVNQSAAVVGGKVEVEEPLTIKKLSVATGLKAADIIKHLLVSKGLMSTVNSGIETEDAMEVCLEYDIELEVKELKTAEEELVTEFDKREIVNSQSRPPVVTILGHVDHGKTSLLDQIRQADIASHEAGGITQHVGAYRVSVKGEDGELKKVVFLDTPGHEAFTSMRARGASLTDIIVLVVAADDGVMPQTIESINHAKAAGVPIIVALNKIDKAEATPENLQKIYGQLAEHGLNTTEWGGDTEVAKVSAIENIGITNLLEIIDLQAQVLELTADYGGTARGTVIEAEMQTGRGPVARVLLQDGNMQIGDFIVSGRAFGRVRDMTDDTKTRQTQAGPSTPLEVSGLDTLPNAGDKFYITDTLAKAETIANQYRQVERQRDLTNRNKITLDNFAAQLSAGETQTLRVVLKADVQGSMDVLKASLEKLGNDEVSVKVIHAAVGGITEGDVLLADASDAIVLGFHVVAASHVRDTADRRHVDIKLYRIIYEALDDVKLALEGLLTPEIKEIEIGVAKVQEIFKISKLGMVAGCLVESGSIKKGDKIKMRVVRDGIVVTDNRKIDSIRRVKDEVNEVKVGTECGIRLEKFEDIKAHDLIICYQVNEVARKLED